MVEDYADKTEAPTAHRRAEARRAGDVARSPELVAAVMCLGAVLLVRQFGQATADAFAILIKDGLGGASSASAGKIGYLVGSALAPVFAGIVLVATAAHLAQGGFAFRLPLRGISPAKNLSEMFGGRSATQLAANVAKLALVSVVTYFAARGRVGEIVAMQGQPSLDIAKASGAMLFAAGVRVGVALLVVGVIDYAWRRWRHEQSLRMTRREVKEEQRRLEGAPETKRRRRQSVANMAAARLDKQIASADVIVAGKDVAVAVAFDPATMVAPRVVVRGKSAAAKSICEKAEEKNVALVERDALAGALFRAVAVGHDVPERFFAAVADVIAYAKQLAVGEGFVMAMLAATKTSLLDRARANRGMIFPLGCVGLLLVLLIPLPRVLLDFLLVANLALSVVILVTTIYIRSPKEFAAFPSLLLAITLLRLVLNVATTRLVLGGDGTEYAAGQVVQAFANLVTGDSVAVGAIIFLIIFVIQFLVIAKGGSRIAEVAARFELDALPGKQMAIDADVNAGLLTPSQAKKRREAIQREADFYSAMEGGGKFVRGDAIACVVITLINIVGGFAVGFWQKGMSLGDALDVYTKLTIGDGLVSQVPAFVVALAAGLIITRSGAESDLGEDVVGQILAKPRALIVAAAFLGVLAMLGMPIIPLGIVGGCCVGLAYVLRKPAAVAAEQGAPATPAKREAKDVERLLDLDVLELEIGHGLGGLANDELVDQIIVLREQIAIELGIVVPAVNVHDSDRLGVNDYAIKIRGQLVARGVAYPEQFLAIDTGEASGSIEHGEMTEDPARRRLAYWITESQRDDAEALGYHVLEAPAVMLSHLGEVVKRHAHELLTRQTVKNLLDNLKTRASAVVEEVVPTLIKPGELQKVLQNLLRERVPVRDLETILETLGDHAGRTKDTEMLTDAVRVALGRAICKQYADEDDRLHCLMLDPLLEERIAGHLEHADDVVGNTINTMPPAMQQQIGEELVARAEVAQQRDQRVPAGAAVVVLTSPAVRSAVRKLVEPLAPHLAVLSLAEVVGDVRLNQVGVIGAEGDGEPGKSLTGSGEDGFIEDGYEPANV